MHTCTFSQSPQAHQLLQHFLKVPPTTLYLQPTAYIHVNDRYINLPYTANDTGEVPDHFLPFGALLGDSTVPLIDDGSTEAIQLSAGIPFFGTTYDQIYVSLSSRYI